MKINLEIRDVNAFKTVLYWTVEKDFKENANHFGFIPQLSESPNGPWLSLFKDPISAYGFIDTETQRGMIDQRLYYRIKGINKDNNSIFYSQPVISISNENNCIANYISENEQLLLRRYNGHDMLLFARRKFGNRCPDCYSEIDRKVIKSKCPTCYGTTWEGGYFAPLLIQIQTDPKTETSEKSPYGKHEQEQLTGWTSNEIIIAPGDLLVNIKNTIQRYEVILVTPTSLHDTTVKQMLTLNILRPDRPEQLLQVNSNDYITNEFNIFRKDWRKGW